MKKTMLALAMSFAMIALTAQESGNIMLSDQQVVPPQFEGVDLEQTKVEIKKAPICCFLEQNLSVEGLNKFYLPEGTVAIEFTINADGKLSNFVVANSVNHYLDKAVIDCIKKTRGLWRPGEVNGQPSPMEKRVYVRFDDPNNRSFNAIARDHYMAATKRYYEGKKIARDIFLTDAQKQRKSERFYNNSLKQLQAATVYLPNDPSLAFWKAKNYEALGMRDEMNKMMQQRKALLSLELKEQRLDEHYDLAIISLQK
ncbi:MULTISPECIES: energy transducer TonB [unclassified Carboxylicivirga]|uniref:energy transducer TonB n=1 Tax=Carboxylicivirga TaxID=1628153 RepID=UPI003D35743B